MDKKQERIVDDRIDSTVIELHRYYTDYGLITLCTDCAALRRSEGEFVQWAETPIAWELAELSCYDCDLPATDDDDYVICHTHLGPGVRCPICGVTDPQGTATS